MNKNTTLLLLIVGAILAFFMLRKKRDPITNAQLKYPDFRGGGGGSAPPANVPRGVTNSAVDAINAGSRFFQDLVGLFRSPATATSPSAAYVGAVQQVGALPSAPSAQAVQISGFDAPASFGDRYAGWA